VEFRIPPLRERREDVPLLARHFVGKLAPELGKDIIDVSEGALKLLLAHDWPGNVRELENAVERAMVTCRTRILTEEDFPFLKGQNGHHLLRIPAGMTLQELERQAIVVAMERSGGNVKEAASALGIDRSTLYDKLKRYEVVRA